MLRYKDMTNIKSILYLSLLAFVLFACSSSGKRPETVDTPEDIIDYEQMVDIVVDYHLAESTVKYYTRYGAQPKPISEKVYAAVFEKHNISRAEFRKSIKYYTADTERMQILYSDVMERLSSLDSKISGRQ